MSVLEIVLGICSILFPIVALLIGYYAAERKLSSTFLTKDDCKYCHSRVEISSVTLRLNKFLDEWDTKSDDILRLQIELAVAKEKINRMED